MAENEVADYSDVLKALGLTEYEAKAYVTLLKYGTLTAEKISELGRIPLPRVYDTIAELQKKGFVLIGHSRPKRFKPMPPDKAIGMFLEFRRRQTVKELEDIKGRAADAVKALKGVHSVFAQEEGFNVWSLERRGNLTKFVAERVKTAKEEVLSFSGDISWIKDMAPPIKDAIRRGVKMRILVHDPSGHPNILNNVKLARHAGADVKFGYTGLLRCLVIDRKNAYVFTKLSDKGVNIIEGGEPGTDVNKKYELMIIDNPSLVEGFRELFLLLWKEAGKK